jgi:Mg2+/Co2+ transporter CorB
VQSYACVYVCSTFVMYIHACVCVKCIFSVCARMRKAIMMHVYMFIPEDTRIVVRVTHIVRVFNTSFSYTTHHHTSHTQTHTHTITLHTHTHKHTHIPNNHQPIIGGVLDHRVCFVKRRSAVSLCVCMCVCVSVMIIRDLCCIILYMSVYEYTNLK